MVSLAEGISSKGVFRKGPVRAGAKGKASHWQSCAILCLYRDLGASTESDTAQEDIRAWGLTCGP